MATPNSVQYIKYKDFLAHAKILDISLDDARSEWIIWNNITEETRDDEEELLFVDDMEFDYTTSEIRERCDQFCMRLDCANSLLRSLRQQVLTFQERDKRSERGQGDSEFSTSKPGPSSELPTSEPEDF